MQTTAIAEPMRRTNTVHGAPAAGNRDARSVLDGADTLVRGVVRRHLGSRNAPDVDDVVQDVLVKVVRSLHQFDSHRATASGWLYSIARNHCYDVRRHRPRTVSLEARRPSGRGDPLTPSHEEPRRLAESAELGAVLESALEALPPRVREAVVLRDVRGLGYGAIARRLGWKVGTVKSRLHRARIELRDRLKRSGWDVGG